MLTKTFERPARLSVLRVLERKRPTNEDLAFFMEVSRWIVDLGDRTLF